ncbi:hypothetical protein OL548_00480 [Lysinibacillus sp. MHQ-1]|nr:hypothetical protein OL548_00480 [Lysinibacillus sp. MHQ-1]
MQEISEKFFVVIEKLKALKEILLDGKKAIYSLKTGSKQRED